MADTKEKARNVTSSQDKEDFIVERGQLTFDAEGDEDHYYSRKIHWPGGVSGVTIGRGYDMGQVSEEKVKNDLMNTGLSETVAGDYAKGAGLTGKAAKKFVDENQDKVPDITPAQQKTLFAASYKELEADSKRVYATQAKRSEQAENRKRSLEAKKKGTQEYIRYNTTEWDDLHPAIRDIVVDLRYRGDYTTSSRKFLQSIMERNDLEDFAEAIKDKKNWSNVLKKAPSRFPRRVKYIDEALKKERERQKQLQSPILTVQKMPTADAQSPSSEPFYPQFLLPLGTQTLGVLQPLTIALKEMAGYEPPDYSFEHLPFFAESRAALQTRSMPSVTPPAIVTRQVDPELDLPSLLQEGNFAEPTIPTTLRDFSVTNETGASAIERPVQASSDSSTPTLDIPNLQAKVVGTPLIPDAPLHNAPLALQADSHDTPEPVRELPATTSITPTIPLTLQATPAKAMPSNTTSADTAEPALTAPAEVPSLQTKKEVTTSAETIASGPEVEVPNAPPIVQTSLATDTTDNVTEEPNPASEIVPPPAVVSPSPTPALQAFAQRTQEPYDNLPVTWTPSTPAPALADLADTSAPTAPSIQDIPPAETTPIRQPEVPTLQAPAEIPSPILQAAPSVEAPIEGSTPPTLQAKAAAPVDPMVEPVAEPPLQTLTSPANSTLQARLATSPSPEPSPSLQAAPTTLPTNPEILSTNEPSSLSDLPVFLESEPLSLSDLMAAELPALIFAYDISHPSQL
ncbi:pesticin C-terminus-like muramidase [Anthocerotibacter panamensis]|uniref:pesticin C-terminus-like muramidase n=1 Tax=Anthocerotibacter panamensis TaxID=2857077 RepID=UPI001C405238|nr:pesticin C-terminus-like muramidase [Anthocerotibacter panamensis]